MRDSQYISWPYRHYTSSISYVSRTKYGEYFGKIKHTIRHLRKRDSEQMARVHFNINKRSSIVPFCELTFISKEIYESHS